jgi:ankyrin repeat protein
MARQMDLREAKDPVQGTNALHFAAVKGRLEVCRFLVEESGFDVNCTDADGEHELL